MMLAILGSGYEPSFYLMFLVGLGKFLNYGQVVEDEDEGIR